MLQFETTIDLTGFYKKYARLKKELTMEMRIALVNTREDFIKRVASIVGSVPAAGGNIPSPYLAFYSPLSSEWLEKKMRFGYMTNIGVAEGDLLQWLIEFADNPPEVAMRGGFQEITFTLADAPEDIKDKVWMMESGKATWTDETGKAHPIPARPIFRPVVVWYLTQEGRGMSPFYREAIRARDRAIQRVYGNT